MPHTPESRTRENERRRLARAAKGAKSLIPPKGEDVASLYPHLIQEWHVDNEGDLTLYRPGSNKVFKWVCPSGHVWETRIHHRTAGNGCMRCRNKMSYEENKRRRRESFKKWYYDDNHGADKAAKKRMRRYEAVSERHGKICYLCLDSEPVEYENSHIDHVIPRSAGGPDSYSNLRITHWSCNLTKGRKKWLGPIWFGYLTLGL